MDETKIKALIQERLDQLSGEKTGGSGHISSIGYGNPQIIEIKGSWISFRCEVWIQSEFMAVNEDDEEEFNPYHYWKNGAIEIIEGKVTGFQLD